MLATCQFKVPQKDWLTCNGHWSMQESPSLLKDAVCLWDIYATFSILDVLINEQILQTTQTRVVVDHTILLAVTDKTTSLQLHEN